MKRDKSCIRAGKSLLDYKGYLKGRSASANIDDIRKAARRHVGKKIGRT